MCARGSLPGWSQRKVIKARRSGALPVAARAGRSCLRPAPVSACAGPAANERWCLGADDVRWLPGHVVGLHVNG